MSKGEESRLPMYLFLAAYYLLFEVLVKRVGLIVKANNKLMDSKIYGKRASFISSPRSAAFCGEAQ